MTPVEKATYTFIAVLVLSIISLNIYIFFFPNSWIGELYCKLQMFNEVSKVHAFCIDEYIK